MNEDWKGLNLPDLIDLLAPVPEPAPVSMVPQTAGWIWLGLGLLAVLAAIIWNIRIHRKKNAYRRQALEELKTSADTAGIAQILRRTALVAYPRANVASLNGDAWLSFLDNSYSGNGFSNGPGKLIADGPYQRDVEATNLVPLARKWIKTHHKDVP
ncbi:MAG: DUF4381 domain-containing protein [Roseibium sp.]